MRLRLVCRDWEYMNALKDVLSASESDVYIEIPEGRAFEGIDAKTLIVTDYMPEDFNMPLPNHLRERTVFLTTSIERIEGSRRTVEAPERNSMQSEIYIFKYKSLNDIVAELAEIYFELTGELVRHKGYARIFYVCTDSEGVNTSEYSRMISRQIVYRKNSQVMIIPLSYINEYACQGIHNNSSFSRLMYYMEISRNYPVNSFISEDEYGVNTLKLQEGSNPIAYMKKNEVTRVLNNLAKKYDVLIVDVGTNYSRDIIEKLEAAEKVFLIKAHACNQIREVVLANIDDAALITVDITNGYDAVELVIDEKVCEVVGAIAD